MNGFIAKTLAGACGASLLALGTGCAFYDNLVDPCYPARYQHMSREEARGWISPQVENGHILEQTVWNYHFIAGTATLTLGGQEHLAYLARRRPTPDPVIYLQTAQDVTYNPAAPDELARTRARLDSERVQAIQRYLNAETAGRGLAFNVVVHDPADPSIAASGIGVAVQKLNASPQGVLAGGGGGAAAGGR